MSKTDDSQSLRGYRSISEALEPVKKLAEWQAANRPDMKILRCLRKDYDLFQRWPMAGRAQPVPIEYKADGRMLFMGMELKFNNGEARYKPRAAKAQDSHA